MGTTGQHILLSGILIYYILIYLYTYILIYMCVLYTYMLICVYMYTGAESQASYLYVCISMYKCNICVYVYRSRVPSIWIWRLSTPWPTRCSPTTAGWPRNCKWYVCVCLYRNRLYTCYLLFVICFVYSLFNCTVWIMHCRFCRSVTLSGKTTCTTIPLRLVSLATYIFLTSLYIYYHSSLCAGDWRGRVAGRELPQVPHPGRGWVPGEVLLHPRGLRVPGVPHPVCQYRGGHMLGSGGDLCMFYSCY